MPTTLFCVRRNGEWAHTACTQLEINQINLALIVFAVKDLSFLMASFAHKRALLHLSMGATHMALFEGGFRSTERLQELKLIQYVLFFSSFLA